MSSVSSESIGGRSQTAEDGSSAASGTDTRPNRSGIEQGTSPKAQLEAMLRQSRTDLLDLTLRNNMLNFRLPKGKGLELKEQEVEPAFQLLVRDHGSMGLLPIAEETDAEPAEVDGEGWADDLSGEVKQADSATKSRMVLRTPYKSDQLGNRLLQTYRVARTYVEEQGANILFLATGFLEWYESDSSDKPLQAPLILVPIQLERDTARDRFFVKYTDEDIVENLSLKYRMKTDFRIEIPDLTLDEGDIDVAKYFSAVERTIAKQKRWIVRPRKMVIGFFSFGKYLMFRDLDREVWPDSANPLDHPILSSLLGDGFQESPSYIDENARLDDVLPLSDMRTVLDADSSQLTAVVDVARGRNLVIQGPPGTGKSQTITNIIARAVLDRKSVLFVAEKMAALEVVKNRLERVGLGPACLELHSNKTNKRQLLTELDRTWQLSAAVQSDGQMDELEYTIQRQRLNEYADVLHKPIGTSEVTPYQAMGTMIHFDDRRSKEAWPTFEVDPKWDRERYVRHRALVSDVQALVEEIGVPVRHPFWGCQIEDLPTGAEREELLVSLGRAREVLNQLNTPVAEVAQDVGLTLSDDWENIGQTMTGLALLSQAPDLHGVDVAHTAWGTEAVVLADVIADMQRIREMHDKYDAELLPDTWDKDLSGTRKQLLQHQSNAFRFFSSEFRSTRAEIMACLRHPVKQAIPQVLGWIADVIEVQAGVHRIMREQELLASLLGPKWRGEGTDWRATSEVIHWHVDLHDGLRKGHVPKWVLGLVGQPGIQEKSKEIHESLVALVAQVRQRVSNVIDRLQFKRGDLAASGRDSAGEDVKWIHPGIGSSVSEDLERLQTWQERIDALSGIVRWNRYSTRCLQEGLASLPGAAASWELAGQSLIDAFTYRWYEALLQRVFKNHPNLAEFSGNAQSNAVERFRTLDQAMTKSTQSLATIAHRRRTPTREGSGGEVGVLRREIQKKARHLPIRRLLEQAGHAVQGLKPVFMASPLSVATFIPPGSLHFDLVVFDEASQVQPVDAFGAILRGRQLVVVGDSKQLPPTNFFDVSLEDDESDDVELHTGDMESILGLCVSQGMTERMLRWHYRSRHESLVAVSNAEFYDHRLVVFPSPHRTSEATGLVLHHLERTAYDRGGSRTNRLEARAVAEAVMAHARAFVAGDTNDTLGVVAFSSAQTDAIEDEVDRLRRTDLSTEAFFSRTNEKFFVKNLETVQGDERDVIFISVGYGRDAAGYLSMTFGPLGKAGGERRLNVLITRARVRCEVFTNLRSDDIDLERAKGEGVRVFKKFLHFCESGQLDLPFSTDREMDSPFEVAVHDALVSRGNRVDTQIGSAGFFVDLAVVDPEHPGRYLIGIECDGAAYHSSRSARDRDRLRQEVLEGLGWKIHRIWSTDWFRNKGDALEKLVKAIETTKRECTGSSRREPVKTESVDGVRDGKAPSGGDMKESMPTPVTQEESTIGQQVSGDGRPKTVTNPYTIAVPKIYGRFTELHEVPPGIMGEWIRDVVNVEGPVHVDVVVRRIADACGVKRVGNRIRAAYDTAVRQAVRKGLVERKGDFLWKANQNEVSLRDRTDLPQSEKKFGWIAREEIARAVLRLIEGSYGYAEEELISDTGRILGFQRVTQEMREGIAEVVALLRKTGRIFLEGVNYVKAQKV